jgi:hypothetical protein
MPRPRDWYPDTDPKALQVFIDLQRKMTPGEKTAGVFKMNEAVRRIRETRERKLYPRACLSQRQHKHIGSLTVAAQLPILSRARQQAVFRTRIKFTAASAHRRPLGRV